MRIKTSAPPKPNMWVSLFRVWKFLNRSREPVPWAATLLLCALGPLSLLFQGASTTAFVIMVTLEAEKDAE